MGHVYQQNDKGEYVKLDLSFCFTQVYKNAYKVISKLKTASSLHLLFWVITNMDEYNTVKLRKKEKLKFSIDYRLQNRNLYSISTINKAIKDLVENDILVSQSIENERLGSYTVNPIYFWIGENQNERKQFIIETLKFKQIKKNEENRIQHEEKNH